MFGAGERYDNVAASHLFASITFSKEGAPHQNFFVGRSEGGGAVFFISKNLPLKGKFFEMVSWRGLGRLCPPQESPLPVPCPPGGSGGLRPPGISVNYPCLASAAAVPCPRALPPIFFRPKFFVQIFFVRIFFVRIFFENIFSKNIFRKKYFSKKLR